MFKTSNLVLVEVKKSELITQEWLDKVIEKNEFVTVEDWSFNNQGEVEITSMYPVELDEMEQLARYIAYSSESLKRLNRMNKAIKQELNI